MGPGASVVPRGASYSCVCYSISRVFASEHENWFPILFPPGRLSVGVPSSEPRNKLAQEQKGLCMNGCEFAAFHLAPFQSASGF